MDPEPSSSPNVAPSTRQPAASIPPSLMVACVLAWLGTLVSLLLLERHAGVRAFLCPAEGGCEEVLTSEYATMRGVPLPLAGVVFYFAMLGLLLAVHAIPSRSIRQRLLDGVVWLTVVGVTFSAGLMYLQFGVLHAFCSLCTLSALIMVGLLVAAIRAGRDVTAGEWGASAAGACTLGIFAILPAIILLSSALTPEPPARSAWLDLSTARLAGPAEARVQVVVFSDFQCQFCRQFSLVLKRIRADFPQDVRVAFRYFPLEAHPRAYPAAVAAECAGEQGAFWEYHDKLFAEGGDLSDAKFLELAAALGLDQERFAQCLSSEKVKKRVAESRDDALKTGLEGAPTVFINGQRVQDLDYEAVVKQIRALLPPSP